MPGSAFGCEPPPGNSKSWSVFRLKFIPRPLCTAGTLIVDSGDMEVPLCPVGNLCPPPASVNFACSSSEMIRFFIRGSPPPYTR